MHWNVSARAGLTIATLTLLASGVIIEALRADTTAPTPGASTGSVTPTTSGLNFVKGPDRGAELVQNAGKDAPDSVQKSLGWGDRATLKTGPILQQWTLNTREVAAGKGLDAASSSPAAEVRHSYLYMLEQNGKGVGSVEIVQTPAADARIGSMSGIYDSDSIIQGLAMLVQRPEVKGGSYEVRLLGCGPLIGSGGTRVVWLKDLKGSNDLVYTAAVSSQKRFYKTLEAEKLYTADEFLKIARPLIEQRMKLNMQTPGGRGPRG